MKNTFWKNWIVWSYWLLFILLPTGLFVATLGVSKITLLATIPLLLVLMLVGERGFRLWSNLLHKNPSQK